LLPLALAQDNPQIGHAVPARRTAIYLEIARNTNKPGVDFLFAAIAEEVAGDPFQVRPPLPESVNP
jgi:hypothetical protein